MTAFTNIQVTVENGIFSLVFAREKKRNAINEQTMDELLEALKAFPADSSVKIALLKGKGRDFCAGADLDWMRNTQQMDEQALQQQNMKLQKVFELWHNLPVLTICQVHGNVVGGALGLMAASDLVIARPESKFRFSEVTLGLMPATIAPFVLQRTASRFVRNAMFTAMEFRTDMAFEHGLVDVIADQSLQQSIIDDYVEAMNKTEPGAVAKTKKLCNDLVFNKINEPIDEYTTALLASVRKSDETARRIAHFFESIDKKHGNK